MSLQTEVVLCKGGTAEHTITADRIEVPDLWHIAEWIDNESERPGRPQTIAANLKKQAEAIRETWSLAHDLKRHVIES